jgi:tetratricopeptide (TPR) repeat protein
MRVSIRSSRRASRVFAGSFALLLGLLALGADPARSQDSTDRDLLAVELERTDNVLQQVREIVAESNNPRLHDLFSEAMKIQEHAKGQYIRGGTDISAAEKLQVLQLTRRSRDLALRIQREVRADVTREERTRLLLERSRVLLERLEEQAAETREPRFRAALDEARRQILLSEQHFSDGNFDVALRLAESAHDLLRNMIQGARRQLGNDRVEGELHRTDELIERARERAEQGTGDATQILDRASAAQRKAYEAFNRGQNARALEFTQEARQALRRILDRLEDTVTEDDVRRALDRFDAKLERIREVAGGELPGSARALVDQALEARGRAMQALGTEEYVAALTHLRVGLDLLNRAAHLVGPSSN